MSSEPRKMGRPCLTHCDCGTPTTQRFMDNPKMALECPACRAARELRYREDERARKRTALDERLAYASRAGLLKYLEWGESMMIREPQ
jgi:hypothetical protein